jgi:hypothetical protein
MVSVRPLSELTTAPEGCFALVGACSSLTLKYEYPGGVAEKENFEAFSHPQGTIIKIENMTQDGGTIWGLTAVLDSGEEFLLHLPAYEENLDFWENKPTRAHEFLGFLNSEEVADGNTTNRPVSIDNRCDKSMFGPRMHHVTDGIKPTPLDFSLLSNAFPISALLSVNGVGHITAQYIHGIDMSWRNWPCVTLAAKTLSGMLRQLCEWRELYLSNIATEYYAEDAFIFLQKLGITEEMIEELKNSEIPMPTERFIKGYGNPRHGFLETGIMPLSLKNHLKKQLFYRNLSTLEAQHPTHPEISETLKKQEKEVHQKNIIFYANAKMVGVPIEEITIEEIYDCYYMRGRYKGLGLDAPFSHEVPMVSKALQAARFFDAIS